jgi:hypothetical protein
VPAPELSAGLDPLHVALQALSALGVMLTGATARQVGGVLAGLFCALACLSFMGMSVNVQALYNTTALPFLGAVLLLVGAASVKRPGPAGVVLTALVGALLASVHSACVLSVVSVVWVALLAPRHRVKLAALGATVFVATALAIGPAAWITTAYHVLSVATGAAGGHHAATSGMGAALAGYGALMALALCARLVARPEQRGLADVALAIALPMLAASFAAGAMSTVPTNAKYLAHVAPAGAVLVTCLAAAAVARTSGAIARLTGRLAVAARVVSVLFGAAIVSSVFRRLPLPTGIRSVRSLSFREAAAIPRELAARGFTYAQVYRSIRSPDSAEILASFEIVAPAFPVGPGSDDPTLVYVAKVQTTALPRPLPEPWVIAAEDGDSTVVLVFARSFLSWKTFTACDRGACVESGLSLPDDEKPLCVYCVPGMPPFQSHGQHALELRMTVQATVGGAHAIVMGPPRPPLCAGTIASVPAGPASISADHRRATWVEPPRSGSPQEVRLDWAIGSSECEMNAYSGLPPFFLEGDPGTVEQLERLGL